MPKSLTWWNFDIIKTLGEGHAGVVLLAKLNSDWAAFPAGSLVAIKRYKRWVIEQGGQFERIVRELEVGRKVRHPNLVQTLSILPDPESRPCLVMRFYDGPSLENHLNSLRLNNQHLDLGRAVEVMSGLASALVSLHGAGTIHRDIKPSNILLTTDGPVVMDFGVVKSNAFPEQTTTGSFLGTIRYAAPEYIFGEPYDNSVDLYGFGAVVYEMFMGKVFLSNETNWARLIVEKSKGSAISCDYPHLHDRLGLGIAEFVKGVIETTLAEPSRRFLKLESLIAAIDKSIWNKSFFFQDGEIVEGIPKFPNFIDAESDQKQLVSLGKVVASLSVKAKLAIKHCMDRWYFEPVLRYLDVEQCFEKASDRNTASETIMKLERLGVLLEQPSSDLRRFSFHETIRAAYRYGVLNEPRPNRSWEGTAAAYEQRALERAARAQSAERRALKEAARQQSADQRALLEAAFQQRTKEAAGKRKSREKLLRKGRNQEKTKQNVNREENEALLRTAREAVKYAPKKGKPSRVVYSAPKWKKG